MSEFEVKDTASIQLASLQAFAKEIGYWYSPFSNSFVEENDYGKGKGFKGCEILKFNTMVTLHNTDWAYLNQGNVQGYFPAASYIKNWDQLKLDAYKFNKAMAARIVHKVNMNGGRKGVSVIKHQVKFIDPAYEHLFLGGGE